MYVDETLESVPRVFYVGKGNAARVRKPERNKHHANVAEKHGCCRKVVASLASEAEALALEVELIAQHKTYVYGEGYAFGCNYTRGGDGVSGLKHSPESIEKNRSAHTGLVQQQSACEQKRASMRASSKVKRRRVTQSRLDGSVVAVHSSVCAAASSIGKPGAASLISRCCRGKSPVAYGYCWSYASEGSETFDRMGNRSSNDDRRVVQRPVGGSDTEVEHSSIAEAARSIGKNTTSIRLCCHGKRQTAYGFTWRFVGGNA